MGSHVLINILEQRTIRCLVECGHQGRLEFDLEMGLE